MQQRPTRRHASLIVAMAVCALLLAGCLGGSSGSSTSNTPSTSSGTGSGPTKPPIPAFDGKAALAFAKGLALGPDGQPRFRMPGTPGQTEGAAYLWQAADVPGWTRHWQNFTGQDYMGLDLRSVADYGHGSQYCPDEDWNALPSWPFHNLYAVRPSPTGQAGHTIVIAAHWDSQMHSQNDVNASRRAWPDPGANDGASGVGVLLQLMRHLGNTPLNATVVALFVDGEDGFFDCYPLAGSLMFAQHPPLAVGRFLLLDMVGDADARFAREAYSSNADPGMLDLLWLHAADTGATELFSNESPQIEDDHVAFIRAGIPSADLIDAGRMGGNPFPPQWDTTYDTVDKLSTRTMGAVGQVLAETLKDPRLTSLWPDLRPSKSPQ